MPTNFWQIPSCPAWTPNLTVRTQKADQFGAGEQGLPSCGFGARSSERTLTDPQCQRLYDFSLRLIIFPKEESCNFQYETSHLPHCGWCPQAQSLPASMNPRSKPQRFDPETLQVFCAHSCDHHIHTTSCAAASLPNCHKHFSFIIKY